MKTVNHRAHRDHRDRLIVSVGSASSVLACAARVFVMKGGVVYRNTAAAR